MPRVRDLNREYTWRQRHQRQSTSGLSVPAFCARERISVTAFYAWRHRLAARSLPARLEPPLFVPLNLDSSPRQTGVVLSHGVEVSYQTKSVFTSTLFPSPSGCAASWLHSRPPTQGGHAMIMLPSAVRIFLCTRSTDLRKSFDGLSGLVQDCFGQDPLTGHLFLFLNRRRDRIKILYFDRDGLAIWYKRLEAGSYQMPQALDQDSVELQPRNSPCYSQGSTCALHANASDSSPG